MNWDSTASYDFWSKPIPNRAAKEAAGRRIAEHVSNGQVFGVGSGSTAYLAIGAIAERVHREDLHIAAICTSAEAAMACAAADIPITTLLKCRPDWCFDGADEVDPDRNLIKGRGGAMYLEKIVIQASAQTFILVDESKLVDRLGTNFAVPIEVSPAGLRIVERELPRIGAVELTLRAAGNKDGPVITENGNYIIDARFREIHKSLEKDIKSITGVIESGLFIGYSVELIIAGK